MITWPSAASKASRTERQGYNCVPNNFPITGANSAAKIQPRKLKTAYIKIVFSILLREIDADALVWVIGFTLNNPLLSLFL